MIVAFGMCVAACATTSPRRLTDREIIAIAETQLKRSFPNENLTSLEPHIVDEVRVRFTPKDDPRYVISIGGVEMTIDPFTGEVTSMRGH